jgi:uncharacterized paraquat-inducible protein A
MTDKPIRYCQEFYTVKFRGKNMKDAYLRACKWFATNVLSKDELHDVYAEYEKDEQSPTVTIHLYVSLTEEVARQEHCKVCKEISKSFLFEEEHCSECKLKGYFNRVNNKIDIKSKYYYELMSRNWE